MEEKIKGIIQKVNMMDKTECDIEAYYKLILEQVTTKEIEVVVEAENGTKRTIQITVNRKKSDDVKCIDEMPILDGVCKETCGEGYYKDLDFICKQCDDYSTCSECYQSNPAKCKKCNKHGIYV